MTVIGPEIGQLRKVDNCQTEVNTNVKQLIPESIIKSIVRHRDTSINTLTNCPVIALDQS